MVFHWSLSDGKSPQVSMTRLRILAIHSSAVIWIVSTRPPTSKSSRLFNNPLVIVPNTPITIGTIVTFMFHSFFNSLARLRYLSFFSLSFRTASRQFYRFSFFFLLIIMMSGLQARISWFVCMLKSHRSLCESFSRTGAGLCIYHLFVWSNWNFLHISQWITLPTQLCLILYSFCANLLHFRLLCDWSFRLCHCIANIYCFIASYLFSLWYDWFLWRCPVLLLEGRMIEK